MDNYTILNMLHELQTWITVEDDVLDLANESTITTKTDRYFKRLVQEWKDGVYDEDMKILFNEILTLLYKDIKE